MWEQGDFQEGLKDLKPFENTFRPLGVNHEVRMSCLLSGIGISEGPFAAPCPRLCCVKLC